MDNPSIHLLFTAPSDAHVHPLATLMRTGLGNASKAPPYAVPMLVFTVLPVAQAGSLQNSLSLNCARCFSAYVCATKCMEFG